MGQTVCAIESHAWLSLLVWALIVADLVLLIRWDARRLLRTGRVWNDSVSLYETAGWLLGAALATVLVYLPRLQAVALPFVLTLLMALVVLVRLMGGARGGS